MLIYSCVVTTCSASLYTSVANSLKNVNSVLNLKMANLVWYRPPSTYMGGDGVM